jgi:hypothetical protein
VSIIKVTVQEEALLCAARVERRVEGSDSDGHATVPAGTVHGGGCEGERGGGCEGEREPAAGRSPTAGQEGRVFLLNSCLIRLIHLSLYREVNLTPKQATN